MATPWERLFVAAARFFAWCAIVTPFAVVAVLVAAALAGRQAPDAVLFVGSLVVQLFATLLVAVVAAGAGATIGIGSAMLSQELLAGLTSRIVRTSVAALRALPAVALGWFGATVLLPMLPARSPMAVFFAALAVVTIAVIPRSHALAALSLTALPKSLRETAAAAGAGPGRIVAFVTLPACARALHGIYADSFSRAVGEAAAVAIVFLAAARAGYPVSLFTLPGTIMLHARSTQMIQAGIAQSALLVLALAAASKLVAVRRIGALLWE